MSAPQEHAEQVLIHYFRQAWEAAGLGWTADNEMEIEEAIGALRDMVLAEIRVHVENDPHIYPDGSTA